MNRTAAVFAALVLLIAGVAGAVAGGEPAVRVVADQAGSTAEGTSNETAEASAPGARLAGVVAVQGAEVEGDLAGREFGVKIARANSNASKATVVAEQVSDLDRRLEELRDRKRALADARRNGSISEARYRAEIAALGARTGAVQHRLNRTAAVSSEVPADLLASRGVDTSAIETLRSDAREVSGPEVADIARSIGGPNAGGGLSDAGNASTGRPVETPSGPAAPADPGDPQTATEPGVSGAPGGPNGTVPSNGSNGTAPPAGSNGAAPRGGPNGTGPPTADTEGNTSIVLGTDAGAENESETERGVPLG